MCELLSQKMHLLSTFPMVVCGVTTVSAETLASNSSWLKQYWLVNMVLDDTLSRRIYSFIGNILKSATTKQIKQKIDFFLFGVRHIGLIVTAVTINGFTPVCTQRVVSPFVVLVWWAWMFPQGEYPYFPVPAPPVSVPALLPPSYSIWRDRVLRSLLSRSPDRVRWWRILQNAVA